MQQVYIYRCEHKEGTYLYLPEKDNFDNVPDSLLNLLGELSFSFEFDLHKNRRLIRTEAKEVIKNLEENGYFLQLPPSKFEGLSKH